MMKKLLYLTLILGLCCAIAAAQEQEKQANSGFSAWLKSLQAKIAQLVPKKTVPMTTGVAGVRGAKEDATVNLYWKGKKDDEAVTEEELLKFKAGVDLADQGNREGAIKAFDEFMKQYPDSALIPDAKKTLDLVKAEPLAEKKVEQKDEKAGEKKEEKQDVKKEETK
jgi:tetratricopeptide (TPR) repeat protein